MRNNGLVCLECRDYIRLQRERDSESTGGSMEGFQARNEGAMAEDGSFGWELEPSAVGRGCWNKDTGSSEGL